MHVSAFTYVYVCAIHRCLVPKAGSRRRWRIIWAELSWMLENHLGGPQQEQQVLLTTEGLSLSPFYVIFKVIVFFLFFEIVIVPLLSFISSIF